MLSSDLVVTLAICLKTLPEFVHEISVCHFAHLFRLLCSLLVFFQERFERVKRSDSLERLVVRLLLSEDLLKLFDKIL